MSYTITFYGDGIESTGCDIVTYTCPMAAIEAIQNHNGEYEIEGGDPFADFAKIAEAE
jgi:hypothetical protein